jgi:hypothetical protein
MALRLCCQKTIEYAIHGKTMYRHYPVNKQKLPLYHRFKWRMKLYIRQKIPIIFWKEYRARKWTKDTEQKLYALIGEITLFHAGIESQLQGMLIEYFDYTYDDLERLFGGSLRDRVKKAAKIDLVDNPATSAMQINLEQFLTEFSEISKLRNDFVKANYRIDASTRRILKFDAQAYHSEEAIQNNVKPVYIEVSLVHLSKLRDDLEALDSRLSCFHCDHTNMELDLWIAAGRPDN